MSNIYDIRWGVSMQSAEKVAHRGVDFLDDLGVRVGRLSIALQPEELSNHHKSQTKVSECQGFEGCQERLMKCIYD
jgi:hypothetical protein